MSYIKEQRQASNFVNGESFARFIILETCVSFVYICICHLAVLFFWIKFEALFFLHLLYILIATGLKWQSSCGWWHNPYHWCVRGRTISVEFSIDSVLQLNFTRSVKILIFLLDVFNTTVRIVKQLNIRNSKASIGTASPAASEFFFK
jgi:hypothetical protein